MEVMKNITRWLFPRTRSCSHFRLTERSSQIFVFHSTNHLSEWKEICRIPVITVDACAGVRITSFPRIRIKNRGGGEAHLPPLIQGPSFHVCLLFRGIREWDPGEMQVALIPIHLFDLRNTHLLRMLWSPAKFGTLLYSDRQEIGTPTSWCHASIFYEPKSFYGIWINVRSAVLATTCQPSRINT